MECREGGETGRQVRGGYLYVIPRDRDRWAWKGHQKKKHNGSERQRGKEEDAGTAAGDTQDEFTLSYRNQGEPRGVWARRREGTLGSSPKMDARR